MLNIAADTGLPSNINCETAPVGVTTLTKWPMTDCVENNVVHWTEVLIRSSGININKEGSPIPAQVWPCIIWVTLMGLSPLMQTG